MRVFLRLNMTPNTQVQRGIEAQQVIDNEAYKDAMQALKSQIVTQWKDCPVRDKEGALLLLQLAKLAEKFEGILSGLVNAGKFAQHQINLDNERDESPARKFFRRTA